MSTAATPTSASPYQLPSASASSSRRTSLDTTTRSSTVGSPALQPTPTPSSSQNAKSRRNRAALRDYYGLKNAPTQHPDGASQGALWSDAQTSSSELDAPGFDAQAHVKGLLEREGLEGILRAEGGLVGEIKSLDGDRKALVYDNYSKLISATDTIRKMRANMDPLAPMTSTLAPDIAHIAGTAEALAATMKEKINTYGISGQGQALTVETNGPDDEDIVQDRRAERREQELATVKWILGAPTRYHNLLRSGDREEAEKDWKDVKILLDRWTAKGVGGIEEITKECEAELDS